MKHCIPIPQKLRLKSLAVFLFIGTFLFVEEVNSSRMARVVRHVALVKACGRTCALGLNHKDTKMFSKLKVVHNC
jgi:hypothetical protein